MKMYSNLVERCFNSCCNDFTSKALSSKEVCYLHLFCTQEHAIWHVLYYRNNVSWIAQTNSSSTRSELEHDLQNKTLVRVLASMSIETCSASLSHVIQRRWTPLTSNFACCPLLSYSFHTTLYNTALTRLIAIHRSLSLLGIECSSYSVTTADAIFKQTNTSFEKGYTDEWH